MANANSGGAYPSAAASIQNAGVPVISSRSQSVKFPDDFASVDRLENCLPLDELLLYSCDLCLAVLSGLTYALFNLFIGHYLTVSVSHNGHPDHFHLLQCIVHFVSAGSIAFLLAFLHHVSINTSNPNPKSNPNTSPNYDHRLTAVYRRQLGIFVRDLTFLVASIAIGFLRSWPLTVPVLIVPVLITAWITLLEKQKPPFVRGLFLAGPLCLFFLNLSLGGLYGTYLVELDVLRQPGIIFTIVAGIGSSAIQFAKARAQFKPLQASHHAPQLYVHDENLDKLEYEKNPVEQYSEDEKAEASSCNNNNEEKNLEKSCNGNNNGTTNNEEEKGEKHAKIVEMIRVWAHIQLFLLKRWPCACLAGILACVAHAFGYPVFTRTTGLFFSVFEDKLGKDETLVVHVRWICFVYAAMGLIVLVAVSLWNTVFGRMGIQLCAELKAARAKQLENGMKEDQQQKKVDFGQLEMVPLLATECLYGIACLAISIASSLQNNRPMGLLAAAIFCAQIVLQHWACKHLNRSKYGRAIGFASTNGMQQLSQALAYTGGFMLVKLGLVNALQVFKIIQTMHLGSMGMTSVVLLANDYAKAAKGLKMITATTKTTTPAVGTGARRRTKKVGPMAA